MLHVRQRIAQPLDNESLPVAQSTGIVMLHVQQRIAQPLDNDILFFK